MQNRIAQVNDIQKRVNAGFPNGVDTESHQQIPVLLARIKELEFALLPFARIGSTLSSNEPDLRDVYTNDLRNAYDAMDPNNTKRDTVEDFGIPAHY